MIFIHLEPFYLIRNHPEFSDGLNQTNRLDVHAWQALHALTV